VSISLSPKSNVPSPKQRATLFSFYNFHRHFTGDESMVAVNIVVMEETIVNINLSFMLRFFTRIVLQWQKSDRFIFQAEIKQSLNLIIIVFIVVGVFPKNMS